MRFRAAFGSWPAAVLTAASVDNGRSCYSILVHACDPPQCSIDHHVRVWLTPTKHRHLHVEVEQKSAVALAELVAALAAMLRSAASALYLPPLTIFLQHHFSGAAFFSCWIQSRRLVSCVLNIFITAPDAI
jgi:hypothetical protein